MAMGKRTFLGVEEYEARCTPSVTPAAGQEFGTGTIGFLRELRTDGLNLGDICSVEKGECAADSLAALSPPGQR